MGYAETPSCGDVSVSNHTEVTLVEMLWPDVKPIINDFSISIKPFLCCPGVNDDKLSPFFK